VRWLRELHVRVAPRDLSKRGKVMRPRSASPHFPTTPVGCRRRSGTGTTTLTPVNSEVWALLGVVVGAMLGALAQIVAGSVEHRHEMAKLVREERRQMYSELLTVVNEAISAWSSVHRNVNDTGWIKNEAYNSAMNVFARGGTVLSQLEIVAPDDTQQAARALLREASEVPGIGGSHERRKASAQRLVEKRKAFLGLAKRDLAA
jgi:hypothetical protein